MAGEFQGGDRIGCAVLIIFVLAVMLLVITAHPWLIVPILLAAVVFMLIKRDERQQDAERKERIERAREDRESRRAEKQDKHGGPDSHE